MPYDDLRKGRFSETGRIYFVTTLLANRDERLFTEFFCARQIVFEMRGLQNEGVVDSLAWVIMPDHLHWVFQLKPQAELPAVMKALKARSAHRINKFLNRQGAVWQRAYYDHALRKDEDVKAIARYIVANPLRAKLVERIEDYPLWDAVWLYKNVANKFAPTAVGSNLFDHRCRVEFIRPIKRRVELNRPRSKQARAELIRPVHRK